MKQKFKPGDKVRVINYGSLVYSAKSDYQEMSKMANQIGHECDQMLLFGKVMRAPDTIQGDSCPPNIITEFEHGWQHDINPELVGKEGIVEGSYYDLFGQENDTPERIAEQKREYSLKGISGKTAWYFEYQLELI